MVPLAAPIEAPIENPYKGLRAFQEADADDFFGRELLTQLLLTRMQEQVPLGRFAIPDDVAAAIAFLADPEASGFVNGVALPVDGGWTADASWTSLRLRKR
jgi:NAD(P)-dependent dehydrogenase (short-subunit alcohol dehydrogenase family)